MINIYKLRFTITQLEIIRFLFLKAGMSFNARALATALDVSQPAISKAIPSIRKHGIINTQKDKDSGRWLIELNRDEPWVMELKRADNLRLVYESGLSGFLEQEFPGGTIILFGSFSRGDDTVESDIDIAIIGRKEKEVRLETYEKILGKRIVINFYSSLKDIHKDLRENLCNGIVLTGGIEL